MSYTDREMLDYCARSNEGVRADIAAAMTRDGVPSGTPSCGLCQAPVANGCEHVQQIRQSKVVMRLMVSRQCRDCEHTWIQPSETGACTKCHSANVVNTDAKMNNLVRS